MYSELRKTMAGTGRSRSGAGDERGKFHRCGRLAAGICAAALVPAVIVILCLFYHNRRNWEFSAYGVSTDLDKTVCIGSYNEGEITIENSGSGKMVTYGADGLSFYYTKLDAQKDNFILSALVTVDSWTMTNGEDDGFGLMVSDSAGRHGDSADFWNNSYMAAVTKVEYQWDPETEKVSNIGSSIVMRQGIAAREKIGSKAAFPEDAGEAAHAQTVRTYTLEDSQGHNGPGTYNIIGNCTPIAAAGGKEHLPLGTAGEEDLLTTVRLEICRDNTGYRIRYIEEDGTVHEKMFYDIQRENLAKIDPEYVYVGFFAARKVRVTFQDVKLTVTEARRDSKAEKEQPEVLAQDFQVTSSHTANTAEYDLIFETNYNGLLSLKDERGKSLAGDISLKAGESVSIPCLLREGKNRYEITFLPDAGSDGKFILSDLSEAVFWHEVIYQKIGDEEGNIYVSPDIVPVDQTAGSSAPKGGNRPGTKENPVSIALAVQYAAPGQRIFLEEGEYLLSEPLDIEPGHDGTEEAPVSLTADPDNEGRPVLNFQGKCRGITLSGDYWVLSGFDCTGSAVNEYGIHVTGSHNRLEDLEIYRNGNTGLHISSRSLWDETSEWPSDNLILNCTSYGNCDDAYEDADGFACQFTAGPGNVFDGCVSHHNADDGWDLYAKVWLEPLGPVTLRNCVAYRNGYLEDGREAGNGNGFKLGGDGMPGGHIAEGCLSFDNKKDGFTSNSCPDVTLIGCTAVDNGGYNIRLYTRNQENTAFQVRNTCSLRTDKESGKSDILEGCGTQDAKELYSQGNYYWDAEKQAAINSEGEQITIEELDRFRSEQFLKWREKSL